jgi:hypothetical protein
MQWMTGNIRWDKVEIWKANGLNEDWDSGNATSTKVEMKILIIMKND